VPLRGARTTWVAVVAWTLLAYPAAAEELRSANAQLPKLDLRQVGSMQVSAALVLPSGIDLGSTSVTPRALRPESNFIDALLLPRLSRQLEPMAPFQAVVAPTSVFVEHPLFQHVSDSTRLRAERGTRRALANLLLEVSSLDALVSSVQRKGRNSLGGAAGNSMKFGVGVYHGLPRVELRYQAGLANLRFRVDAFGGAGIEVSHSKRSYSRCYVGYDNREHEYDVAYRFSF